jgi:hypothetical protein
MIREDEHKWWVGICKKAVVAYFNAYRHLPGITEKKPRKPKAVASNSARFEPALLPEYKSRSLPLLSSPVHHTVDLFWSPLELWGQGKSVHTNCYVRLVDLVLQPTYVCSLYMLPALISQRSVVRLTHVGNANLCSGNGAFARKF